MQVDPIKPTLKAPGTNPLTLKNDEALSTFAFKINLRRYNKEKLQADMDFCRVARGLHSTTILPIGGGEHLFQWENNDV